MQVEKHKVVSFEYTLRDDNNAVIDTSEGGQPLTYIHGTGNLIRGLEQALVGKSPGDSFQVTISPEEGYGTRDDGLMEVVPRNRFGAGGEEIRAGMQFYAEGGSELQVITVVKVEGDKVTVDGNHPLAGMTLNFAVKVVEVRDATEEEILHGHVHGPGEHHH